VDKPLKELLKASRWIFRKNKANLKYKQTQHSESLDLKNQVTSIAHQILVNFQQVYRSRNKQTA
jgi:hypothetical protein